MRAMVMTLLCVVPICASAFEFRYEGKALEDGATVTIYAAEDSWGFGEMECATNPSTNPKNGLIVASTDLGKKSGTASIAITSKTFTANMVQWCMGGECLPMNVKTAADKTFSLDADGICQVQFDATGITTEGVLDAQLTVTIGIERKTVNIRFVNGNAEEPFWWGYFTDQDAKNNPLVLGSGSATTYDMAIGVPAGHPIAGTGTVKAVRFWLGNDLSAISSDVTLWISSSLPEYVSNADYTQKIPKSALKKGLNEIELTTPYCINNAQCYIGYTFSISDAAYLIKVGGKEVPNSWFYRVAGKAWLDSYGEGLGKLALQVLLDGVVLRNNSVTPSDFGTNYALKGSQVEVPVDIINLGKETIHSIAYTITTNGNVSAEKTYQMADLDFNTTTTVYLPFDADSDTRKYDKLLTITKVNDVPNEATVQTATGLLITISRKPVATPVVEEFTGTWCGWCPLGYDGMEYASKTFGDKVVLIAAHSSDPMETSDYHPIAYMVSGYPSSFINRAFDAYPAASTLEYYLNECLEENTIAEIAATACWANEGQTAVRIDTDTRFVYSEDAGQYGIAFVLVEDGMKGTGSSWAQANNLSGNASYAMSNPFWYSSPAKVTGVEFNHVAVAAWNIKNGVNGSIPTAFTAEAPITYSYTADISSNALIQDKTKLKAVALLIDRTTGDIVNAAQCAINDYTTGIGDITSEADSTPVARFSVDGRQLSAPQKGLNIIKTADGRTLKVLVK